MFPLSFKVPNIPKMIGVMIIPNMIHRHSPNGTKPETGKLRISMYKYASTTVIIKPKTPPAIAWAIVCFLSVNLLHISIG